MTCAFPIPQELVANIDSNATLRDLTNVALEVPGPNANVCGAEKCNPNPRPCLQRTRNTVGPSELLPAFRLQLPPSTLVTDPRIATWTILHNPNGLQNHHLAHF